MNNQNWHLILVFSGVKEIFFTDYLNTGTNAHESKVIRIRNVCTVNVSNNYFIYKNESKKTCNPLTIQYEHAWLWHFACMFWTLYHFCQLKWFKSVHAYLISLWDCVNPCSIEGRSLSTNLYFAKCEMYIMCNRIFFF